MRTELFLRPLVLRPLLTVTTVAAFVAPVVTTTIAHADPACIAAYEQTQSLRKDGKLSAAKAQASLCAHSDCPALLVKDCAKWLGELEASTPTVVLEARTAAGVAVTNVRVKMDGNVVAPKIDGKAIAVDPGSRTFLFEGDGIAPVEQVVVLREGEKNRKVTAIVAPAPDAVVERSRPVPLGVWLFGGASVAAFATSIVFAVDGLGKKSDLDACKPRCAAGDIDAMQSSFTVADVFLGAGIMAGAAAAYLFFTRPEVAEAPAGAAAFVRPRPFAAPLPGGGAVGLTTRF